jgi:hypothetical protein
MRQVMKTILLAVLMMFGLMRSASAFSLAGPIGNAGDSWQVTDIGYGPPSDSVAPKNLGEGYRRNTPVVYYTFDANFLEYFGAQGMTAVNGALAIMNNLTNVSSYSPTLSEFPLESRHLNYQAQALGLYDLKSYTLYALMQQMGLADSVQYTWTLHDRYTVPGGTCPTGMEYLVVQRNFDTAGTPIAGSQTLSTLYSPYVNNVLYSYQILEVCQGSPVLAQAIPFSVDPLADSFSAVTAQEIGYGNFYTGLTRDDVMGLRYLYKKTTINTESAAAGSVSFIATTNMAPGGQPIEEGFPINTNNPIGFGTYDLGALLSAAKTNDQANLQLLFPNVITTLVSNQFVLVTNQTITAYFTNFYEAAAGTPAHLVIATNKSVASVTYYYYNFLNIVTNHYYANTTNLLQTITVAPMVGAAAPAPLATNVKTSKIILKGVPSGDYYVLPSTECGLDILNSNYLTSTILTTNLLASGLGTNSAATNIFGQSVSIISSQKSYSFLIAAVTCTPTPAPTGLYAGVEKIRFVEADYDNYLSQNFEPVTNNYTMSLVISNRPASEQHFQRIVTKPDFLFSAQDLAGGNGGLPVVPVYNETLPDFNQDNILPNLAGPGTIDPTTVTLAFEKTGPVYFNTFFNTGGTNYWGVQPGSLDEFYSQYFIWASFDGTTNAPIVYPNGSSLDLTGLILVQVTPSVVPNGQKGDPYGAITFSSTGGSFQPTYTWTAAGLPDGLNLVSNQDGTATLSGTPTQSGSYVFTLTMTDSNSRSVQWNYPIIIQ